MAGGDVRSLKRKSIIDTANDQVDIVSLCRKLGVDVPDDIPEGRSYKTWCPFGFLHADGGIDKALRIYPSSNSCFCFDEKEFYTPVKLYALSKDIVWREAAEQLLDWIGYKPLSLAAAWARASDVSKPIDKESLALALRVYCGRICDGWIDRQFTPTVARKLDACLALLDKVTDDDTAAMWLDRTKLVMRQTLL